MEILIHGRNMNISPRLQSYVERKVERLDRYLPDIIEVRVDLSQEKGSSEKGQKTAQITLRHKRGTILRAEEHNNDFFAAVDVVVDKLYRQIERFKGKRRRRNEPLENLSDYETAVELDEDEFEEGSVIRRKHFAAMPMNEEEAIEQLELLGHDFFVFLNGDTGGINVIYKRRDGNYGLLAPEVS